MIEEIKKALESKKEFYKDAVVNRILGIAALKSIINDASGETELIKEACSKLNSAFSMEKYYLDEIHELEKQLEEEQLKEQTNTPKEDKE